MQPDTITAHTISWATIHSHGPLWYQHHRLRYQAFVARQGWDIPHHDGTEWDQFDTPAARYVLVEYGGQCAAACRLVPTEVPYMLADVFPGLLPYTPPRAPDIWEASRIAVDHTLPAGLRRQCLLTLILAVQEEGIRLGVRHYLGLMPLLVWRMALIRNGVSVRILTEGEQLIDGTPTAAGEIAVDPATVARVRALLEAQAVAA
ncbi:acyl-homoserine-lactone synthase [Novispirillum itersonii]|uniref:acyl-homoserine-lactone synthase n=1 Tax=Novispirillum itersonii TaxID=189 RepID=UPI000373EE20|nr:acyl-homoserine-lactone synthase [Novispirillum itersonii]